MHVFVIAGVSFSLICSYGVHYVSPLTSMVDKYYHVPFNKSSEPCSNKGNFVIFTAINYLRGPFRKDRFAFERFKRQRFHEHFQQEGNCFFLLGKTIRPELLCKKDISLDGQTSQPNQPKLSSQPVHLPGVPPLMKPLFKSYV